MNPMVSMLFLWSAILYGAKASLSPVSVNAKEGKSVYIPLAKPIDVREEGLIQQRDQNRSRAGGR